MIEKLKTKKITGVFAAIAFSAGFLFSNKNFTGNTIISENSFHINPLNIIGILLLICSLTLTYYTFKK